MTGLLEKALRRMESLTEADQDAIATQILDALNDEESWERSYEANREAFKALGRAAVEEHRHGDTLPFEDLIR